MSQHTHTKAPTAVTTAPATMQNANVSTIGDTGSAEPAEQHKVPKPSAAEVTNKVLAVLMVSEPQTVADLCKQMPDLPRDSIQAVLEVLQVLGLVVQHSTTKEAATTKSSSSNSQTFVYALSEFAKFNTAFPLTQIEPEMETMQSRTRDVRARIQELQALTSLNEESMSAEERSLALKDLTTKFTQRNPQLQNDPLYQAISEQMSNTSQSFAATGSSI